MGNALGTPPTGPKDIPRSEKKSDDDDLRRNYTLQELAAYDGTHGKAVYIALKSEVYDVSDSHELYGPGGEFHEVAGTDASRAVALRTFTERELRNLDLSDLDDVARAELDTWVKRFHEKQYPVVGRLVTPMDLTLKELRKYNGVDNERGAVLVAINGTIYDVTLNGLKHYGPEGSYGQFAGRDASRALACMSLDDACLEDPHVDDLSDAQQSSLMDWAAHFQHKYAVVGRVL